MVSEQELIGLLYRADWTKLTLSGTVTGTEPAVDTLITIQSDQPPPGPWARADGEPPPGARAEGKPPWRREDAGPRRAGYSAMYRPGCSTT